MILNFLRLLIINLNFLEKNSKMMTSPKISLGSSPKSVSSTGCDLVSKRVIDYLEQLEDPRKEKILAFHHTHQELMKIAKGSFSKHQAWFGGYQDHIAECFRIAEAMYFGLQTIREVSIRLDSALVVLYFHDIEKIWKYSQGLSPNFDKQSFYRKELQEAYGIELATDELNALKYIHGEPHEEYNATTRLMSPLASFCHCVDTLSARMWYDEGKNLG